MTVPQRTYLLTLLQQQLSSTEVNALTSKFSDPFTVTPEVCEYWRRKTRLRYKEMQRDSNNKVWSEGLALKENRVIVLKKLAERMIADLLQDDPAKERVWLRNLKSLGPTRIVQYREFNHREFAELRMVLNDLALEMGDRSNKNDKYAGKGLNRDVSIPAYLLGPDFVGVYSAVRSRRYTEYVLKGGRGSLKSSSISLMFVETLVNNPQVHGLCARQVTNTLRDSVYAQIQWAINEQGLQDDFNCTVSPMEIEYLPTGQKIYFRGADDPNKIKSIKPPFGHIAILWFEELDQFRGPEAVRKIEQSVIRGGDDAWVFKSFNPPRTINNWANRYVEVPKDSQLVHHSTYLTVPPEWLGKTFIAEAEHLKKVNPDAYEHEYLGKSNWAGGAVFQNVVTFSITDKLIKDKFDYERQGLDWGYFPHPLAWLRMYYDQNEHSLYLYDEYKALKKGNREVFDDLTKVKGVGYDDELIADSSEPKSVGDFRDWGLNCRAAEKGPGSVKAGVKWMQSLKAIYIDAKRCPEALAQYLHYEYEQDKDGNYIDSLPDEEDDFIDAGRYGTNLIWRRRGQ